MGLPFLYEGRGVPHKKWMNPYAILIKNGVNCLHTARNFQANNIDNQSDTQTQRHTNPDTHTHTLVLEERGDCEIVLHTALNQLLFCKNQEISSEVRMFFILINIFLNSITC